VKEGKQEGQESKPQKKPDEKCPKPEKVKLWLGLTPDLEHLALKLKLIWLKGKSGESTHPKCGPRYLSP
jgi:hypothetical protein